METIKIAGVKRADFGKKESKHIRKEGMIPWHDLRPWRNGSLLGGRQSGKTADLYAAVLPGGVRHRRPERGRRHARSAVPSRQR